MKSVQPLEPSRAATRPRRLLLFVASQCDEMAELSFLPPSSNSITRIDQIPDHRRLVLDLYELLTDGPGECSPVDVVGGLLPGLLINPTRDTADAALRKAMRQAHGAEATLMVYYVGHGARWPTKPLDGRNVRHYLQVWDTSEQPSSTASPSNGWDPYAVIEEIRDECVRMTGLLLVVDACYGSLAIDSVKRWKDAAAEFRSVWLASSRNTAAYNGCMTRQLEKLLRDGLLAQEHHDRNLVRKLRAADVAPRIERACGGQAPVLDGWQDWDEAMYLAANRAADERLTDLGMGGPSGDLLLRLTANYVPFFVEEVLAQAGECRLTHVFGRPGSGKSALAAALRNPTDAQLDGADAVAFLALTSTPASLSESLAGQLATIPRFRKAAECYEGKNLRRWDSLGAADRLLVGPLSEYRGGPVLLVLDGVDQVARTPNQQPIGNLLRELTSNSSLAHVRVIVTSRDEADLPVGEACQLWMPELDGQTATDYLTGRGINDVDQREQLIDLAKGNWLVLELAADLAIASETSQATEPDDLYRELIGRARGRHPKHLPPLLGVLAAAPVGPVLPFRLLAEAVRRLRGPTDRRSLYQLLADKDLYRLLDRAHPGSNHEQLGVFHSTLGEWLPEVVDVEKAHQAIYDAIDTLRKTEDHQLDGYAFNHEADHFWAAGQRDGIGEVLGRSESPIPRENLQRLEAWLPILTETLGPDRPATLTTRGNIALWTGEVGKPAEALRLFKELLSDQERASPNHHDILDTRLHIAAWTGQAGNRGEALRLSEELLPDQRRVLGPDARNTLRNRSNIAFWTGRVGKPAQALRVFKELLSDQERVLKEPNHSDILDTRHNIALWTGQLRKPAEALRLFKELLSDQERVLKPNHPDRLATRHNIAKWVGEVGKPAEALRLFKELFSDRKQVLGLNHPDTLDTRHNIAAWTGRAGKPREALRLSQELLPDQRRFLGRDDPNTLRNRSNIAFWTGRVGKPAQALRVFKELLSDQERVLKEPNHSDILDTRHNIALWTGEAGQRPEALRLFEELVSDQERALGPKHPDTLDTRQQIAILRKQLGDSG